VAGFLPAAARERTGDRLHKLADVLASPSLDALYRDLVSNWNRPEALVRGGHEPKSAMTDAAAIPPGVDLWRRLAYLDVMAYLPDDILVKVDRAAMGVSLETRVPLLDHRVAEFAWRLPHRMRVRDGQGKWLLRQLLYQHVPRELVDRPKMGFGVPVDQWLRGPLREWAEHLLDERRLADQGYLDVAMVRQKWREHLEGTRNWQYPLWSALMFQAWLEAQAAVAQVR
jgi:asparagine synthase (glutamine-hydrolysing)